MPHHLTVVQACASPRVELGGGGGWWRALAGGAEAPPSVSTLRNKGAPTQGVSVDLLWGETNHLPRCSLPQFLLHFFFLLSKDASHALVHAILPSSRTLRDLIMDSRLLDPELPLSGGGICHPLSRRSPPLFMLHSTARVMSNPTTLGRMSKSAQW